MERLSKFLPEEDGFHRAEPIQNLFVVLDELVAVHA